MRATTVLILVLFSLISYGQGVKLVGFTPSQCDENSDTDRIQTRIVNSMFKGDTLLIEVDTVATCCVDFSPSIDFIDGVLSLDFQEYGVFCECICCYQFIYHITGLKKHNFVVKLKGKEVQFSPDKYVTYPIKFELLDGDTINYIDKYGVKQGYWYYKYKDGGYRRAYTKNHRWIYEEEIKYNDSSKISSLNLKNGESKVFAVFFDDGILKNILTKNHDLRDEKEFYEDGTLKKIEIFGAKYLILWKAYYPSGKLYQERFSDREDQLYAEYFYETGELMAKHYNKEKNYASPDPKWYCYDKNGIEISRADLIEKGLIEK